MSEFIPSVDELVEVHRAFGALYKIINLYDNVDVQEKRALPYIVRIADALRPVRPLVDRIEGWPKKIERSIPLLIEWFDVLISRWGWEGVVQPEPARSAYLAKRKESAESLRRSILEAAVSASADWNKSTPCKYDDWADEGRKLGILPTMMLEKEVARERCDGPPAKGTSPTTTRAIRGAAKLKKKKSAKTAPATAAGAPKLTLHLPGESSISVEGDAIKEVTKLLGLKLPT